ncbi:hypothetical protein MRX96_014306 [Rhipicephalus microplus]
MKRLGPSYWMIKCESGTFRRHLDHIKLSVDQSQAEDRMPSGHGEQGETTRRATVPAPYVLDSQADSPVDAAADSPVSSSFSLTEQPGPQEPVTPRWTQQHHVRNSIANPPDRYGDTI